MSICVLQQCKRLCSIPFGQKMIFVKAYGELWSSRFIDQPIEDLNTLTMEALKEEVNRCWRFERNLDRDCPVPVRYHHLPNTGARCWEYKKNADNRRIPSWYHHLTNTGSLLNPHQKPPHIIKGKYLFNHVDRKLYCHLYTPDGLLECIWRSDPIPKAKAGGYWFQSSIYYEDGSEILVILTLG